MSDTWNKRVEREISDSTEKSPFKISLSEFLMYCCLVIIGLLFFGLIMAYTYTRFQMNLPAIKIPNIFHANTVIILSSSLILKIGHSFLQKEDFREYAFSLFATCTLGLIFMIFQTIGWVELFHDGVYLSGDPGGAYLYLISGLHVLHIFAGCVPLSIMAYKGYRAHTDVVQELIFSTSPDRFFKFKLVSLYWHFVGLLWLGIYFSFVLLNIITV